MCEGSCGDSGTSGAAIFNKLLSCHWLFLMVRWVVVYALYIRVYVQGTGHIFTACLIRVVFRSVRFQER